MAEGFLKRLASDNFVVASAGIESTSSDPLTAEVMQEVGIETSNQRSLDVKQSLKQHFGYVIVLYDAAKERSPVFPFTRNILRWNVPDPAAGEGERAAKKDAFRQVRDDIVQKVRTFVDERDRAA